MAVVLHLARVKQVGKHLYKQGIHRVITQHGPS